MADRVFTRAKIYGGERYLKNHLSANDYYAEGEKVVGRWVGRAAEFLGLRNDVDADQFEALRENRRPENGERLTPRTKDTREPTVREVREAYRREHRREGSDAEIANFRVAMKPLANRVAFYDFQCSAQKSVSILAVVVGDERLRQAHERAAGKAFAELEQFAARQKNTLLVRDFELTGNLCAAAFTHDASRALDPQLHTHFVVANATRDASGRWYAMEECQMLKAIRYAGKAYQNEMAREVTALGYIIREARDGKRQVTGFEVEGVPDELCARFAKRRAEIEREIAAFQQKHGREPTTIEISRITRETRDLKLAEVTTREVRDQQRAQLSPAEWKILKQLKIMAVARAAVNMSREDGQESAALRACVAHLFERQSVAREHEVLAEALNQALGSVDLGILKKLVKDGRADLVALTVGPALLGEFATRRGLELERWAVAFVDATKGRCSPLSPSFEPSERLSVEQKEAVRAILSTRDQVFSLRGVAGAGKTTTLRELQKGLAGRKVHYVAPTVAAAKVLQGEGFGNATTVEDFLQNVSRRVPLAEAVVVCDEAGLKSNRQGAELLRLAQKYRLRVVFVGDVRQHGSVEAGDFLRVLETHSQLGRCEIREIRRQAAAPEYRSAVERMAAGDVRGGLTAFDRLGWIKEGSADYLRAAAVDYLRLTDDGKSLERCLVVAPTWAENFCLTERVREELRNRGRLPSERVAFTVYDSLRWTTQQRRNARNYTAGQVVSFAVPSGGWQKGESAQVQRVEAGEVWVEAEGKAPRRLDLRAANTFDVGTSRALDIAIGDKVLIRANDRKRGLINGQVLTVERPQPDGSLRTREGVTIPASFRQWCHGYVVTSHKSQGRTCDHVIVAAEKLDAKAAYVACSRGRLSCAVHTPDKKRLLALLPEGTRRAALDALHKSQRPTIAPSIAHRAEAWARLVRDTIEHSVKPAGAWMRQRMERARQIVQRWRGHADFVRQSHHVAHHREQSQAARNISSRI
ncbi:MAG: MobF family relaxase [Chthoniobacter sp.]|uniref:MobF family relaxase n=1 Tax=Chthoniobacter sp. TaxID=2510640 RepID=UPI0032A4358F